MRVQSLLHPRCSSQLHVAGRRRVDRGVGTADRARRWPAIRIGPVANDRHAAFRDRSLQSLVFPFGDVNGQFVGLKIEARIGHLHTAAKDAHAFVRIKKRLI